MLTSFLVSPPKIPYPLPLFTNLPTPAFWSWHSPRLGRTAFTGPRAFPPIDDLLGHPLLHMQLEPWIPPCVFFDWWFSPRKLWGYLLVHIIVPHIGMQTPSAPWVHWGPCVLSNGWLWASTSVFVRHWQSLSQDSYISLLPTSSCWHPQCCLVLVVVYGMNPQVGQSLDGHFFSLCSELCLCNSFHGYFVPPFKKDWSIYILVFLLLEFHVFCKLYLGYSELLG